MFRKLAQVYSILVSIIHKIHIKIPMGITLKSQTEADDVYKSFPSLLYFKHCLYIYIMLELVGPHKISFSSHD